MGARMPTVDIVLPVYNEEHVLARSVHRLREYLKSAQPPFGWRLVIADNGSRDGTGLVGRRLAQELAEVRYVHIPRPGRGGALAETFLASDADAVAYMDIDLSTDLEALAPLLRSVLEEQYDLAVGSRLAPGARVARSPLRQVLSLGYNLLLRLLLRVRLSDAQCGFKALSRRAAQELVPLVQDREWFFDTELLVLAERRGYRVRELPVHWVEDRDSRVRILPTVLKDLAGVARLLWRRPWQGGPGPRGHS